MSKRVVSTSYTLSVLFEVALDAARAAWQEAEHEAEAAREALEEVEDALQRAEAMLADASASPERAKELIAGGDVGRVEHVVCHMASSLEDLFAAACLC